MRITRVLLAALAVATLTAVGQADAQNAHTTGWASYEQRVGELEAEIAALKARIDGEHGVRHAAHGYESSAESYSAGGGGCSTCATSPCGVCSACCRPHGFYAGGALVWMKPHFEDNIAVHSLQAANNQSFTRAFPFDYDYDPASRVWLGYVNEAGLGVRGNYFQYDHSAPQIAIFNPAAGFTMTASAGNLPQTIGAVNTQPNVGDTMVANQRLDLETVDLEATKRIYAGRTSLVFAGGARYAKMRQFYHVDGFNAAGTRTSLLDHNLAFDGVGPTVALDLHRPVGFGGLALFGSARGSILFGETNQTIVAASTTTSGLETRTEQEVLGIFEVRLGPEWAYTLADGSRFYTRGTVDAQLWQNAGSSTNDAADLGLIGFGFEIGLMR